MPKLYLLITGQGTIDRPSVFKSPTCASQSYDYFAQNCGLEADEDGNFDWGESESTALLYVLDTDKGELV